MLFMKMLILMYYLFEGAMALLCSIKGLQKKSCRLCYCRIGRILHNLLHKIFQEHWIDNFDGSLFPFKHYLLNHFLVFLSVKTSITTEQKFLKISGWLHVHYIMFMDFSFGQCLWLNINLLACGKNIFIVCN